jgi:hypothetical protein
MADDWSWSLICDESFPLKLRRLFVQNLKQTSLQHLHQLILSLTVVNHRLLDIKQQAFVRKLEILLRKPKYDSDTVRKYLARGIYKLIILLKNGSSNANNGRGRPSTVS